MIQLSFTSEALFFGFSLKSSSTNRAETVLTNYWVEQLLLVHEKDEMTTIPFFLFFFLFLLTELAAACLSIKLEKSWLSLFEKNRAKKT